MAARGDSSWHFYVFWLAYFLVLVPVAWRLLSMKTPRTHRNALVVGLGIWSMCPSLDRTGNGPLYYDEFSHFRMLQDLVRVGHPVSSTGLLQIGANFPGVELVTSALYHLSGLTLWLSAIGVASLAHVALLFGVYVLVRDESRSSRAGAVAAIVYSLNPSWLFFDAQFSYETLALPVLVWGIVLGLRALRAREGASPRAQTCQAVVSGILIAALVLIHHVTSVIACAVFLGVAIGATVQRRRRGAGERAGLVVPLRAWAMAAWALALTAARFIAVGHPLVVYLGSPLHFSKEFSQLLSVLGIGTAVHTPFGGSLAPAFEVVASYLMLPILAIAFVWAVWGLAGHRRELSPLVYVSALLGFLFFVSLLLVSSSTYAESVHRSWAFSFLGLAIVLGMAAHYTLNDDLEVRLFSRRLWPLPALRYARTGTIALVCLVIVAVGGVSAGTDTAYQFGGTVVPDLDPLYVGTQTQLVATWFDTHARSKDVVWADRFIGRPIAVGSSVRIANPNGLEDLLVLSPTIPKSTFWAFINDKVTYIVFDRRTGTIPGNPPSYWYVRDPTLVSSDARKTIYPGRIACLTWATPVYATSDYEILSVTLALLGHELEDGGLAYLPQCDVGVRR
jgi:hypothetical protein